MILVERARQERWPNFFIVGAPRAGTTSLYQYLRATPGIYMSPVKEPHYFSPHLSPPPFAPLPIRGKAEYLELFREAKDEIAIGEASPSYLSDPDAPRLIHQATPDARIVMILRDPVERAISHYALRWSRDFHGTFFENAPGKDLYVRLGLYAAPLERYLDLFAARRVKVLVFEEFIRDTRSAVGDVIKFLGVDAEPGASIGKAYNSFSLPRWSMAQRMMANGMISKPAHFLIPAPLRRIAREKIFNRAAVKPPISEATRARLEELYLEDIQRLEKILGRPLPWFHRRNRSA